MTAADVPSLTEKTRALMLGALEELSSSSLSIRRPSQAASPTSLLTSESHRSGGYQSISQEAELEGAVAGTSEQEEGKDTKDDRKYAIA